MLIGRGAADMKGGGGNNCMFYVTKEYCDTKKDFKGTIKILLTADEEGDAINGIRKIIDEKVFQSGDLDYCLVGEPSSSNEIGDVIRNGRRGSITGHLTTLHGIQGHVAYPEKAKNPIFTYVLMFCRIY